MLSAVHLGLMWCFCFVVLEAVQAVYFGSVFQRMDAFFIGTCVFGVSTVVSLTWVWVTDRMQLALALSNWRSLLGLNLTSAGAWILYLLSVQMIEPAVSFALFSGAVPLATLYAARCGVPEASLSGHNSAVVGSVLVAVSLGWLTIITVMGYSGFVRGGAVVAFIGSLLAVLSGVFITWMLFYGQRLHLVGVKPLAQFGLRFGCYLALSVTATLLGIDDKGPISASSLFYVLVIGLVIMSFPVFAVQKAVSLVPTLTIARVTALGPLFVFLFQSLEGRVTHSAATLAGLCLYFMGAVMSASGTTRSVNIQNNR